MNTTTPILLTSAGLFLLITLIADSGHWNNMPMLTITNEERGNLTDLKKNNLLHTDVDEGIAYVTFDFASGIKVTDGVATYTLTKGEYESGALPV